MTDSANISIIIPAYNEEKTIGRCLASIVEHTDDIFEVLVIDNNSTDKTAEIAKSFPNVKVFTETQKGVAFARSRGAKEAKGNILAFLDADTYIETDWQKQIEKYFKDEKLVCLSGPTYFYDLSGSQQMMANAYWFLAASIVFPIVGFMGIFANMIIRKSAYDEIGGIDTKIEFYGDDTDIPRRLRKIGKVMFDRHFYVWASGRRFAKEGIISTTFKYGINFFSEVFLHRPVSKGYTEIR